MMSLHLYSKFCSCLVSISKNNSSCLWGHFSVLLSSCFFILFLQPFCSPGFQHDSSEMWYLFLRWFSFLSSNKSLTYAGNSPAKAQSGFPTVYFSIYPLFLYISNLMSHQHPLSCSEGTQLSFLTNFFFIYVFMLVNDIALFSVN